MTLKSQAELDELVRYTKWFGKMKTLSDSWNWLNQNIPNWMQQHGTKVTYLDRRGNYD